MQIKYRLTKEFIKNSECSNAMNCLIARVVNAVTKPEYSAYVMTNVMALVPSRFSSTELAGLYSYSGEGINNFRMKGWYIQGNTREHSALISEFDALQYGYEKHRNEFFEKYVGTDLTIDIPEQFLEVTTDSDIQELLSRIEEPEMCAV